MFVFEDIVVLGAGAMGRQIALQCAMFRYRVTLYDLAPAALRESRAALSVAVRDLAGRYVPDAAAEILSRIHFTSDLEEAVAAADLVSESAPEDPAIKARLFAQANLFAPPHAVFTTNTSTLRPSDFAAATGRPGQFLALHFHKAVWHSNFVDVMPHPGTRPEVVEAVAGFARTIGQLPIVLKAERQGYVFNAMYQAYMEAALALWVDDVASIEDIDRTWMIAHHTDAGPFGTMDFIGLDTVHDVTRYWAQESGIASRAAAAAKLKAEFLDRGQLGVKSGRGFYRYPNPAYREPGFIGAPAAASVQW